MKKYASIIFPVLLMAIIFSGCEHETITQNPGEYNYQMNEPIEIIDIETRDVLGILTITGAYPINDKPFTVRTETGTTEDGEPIYEDIAYEQLLQINYIFKDTAQNNKTISGLNFSPYSQLNNVTVDPKVDFAKAPLGQGESCFTVAFSKTVDQFELGFRYGILQFRKTATIHISLSGSAAQSPPVPENPSTISPPEIPDSRNSSSSVSQPDSSPSSSEDSSVLSTPDNSASDSSDQSVNSSEPHTQFWLSYLLPYEYLLLIAALLLEAVIVLTVVLISKCKKK